MNGIVCKGVDDANAPGIVTRHERVIGRVSVWKNGRVSGTCYQGHGRCMHIMAFRNNDLALRDRHVASMQRWLAQGRMSDNCTAEERESNKMDHYVTRP